MSPDRLRNSVAVLLAMASVGLAAEASTNQGQGRIPSFSEGRSTLKLDMVGPQGTTAEYDLEIRKQGNSAQLCGVGVEDNTPDNGIAPLLGEQDGCVDVAGLTRAIGQGRELRATLNENGDVASIEVSGASTDAGDLSATRVLGTGR
jgi:hypothetical protein